MCTSMHEKDSASAHIHLFTSRVENSADPDQLASKKPADLDQHRFPNKIYPSLAWFCLFDSLRPSQQSFSYVGAQRCDTSEVRTRCPSVSSQALYHLASALP